MPKYRCHIHSFTLAAALRAREQRMWRLAPRGRTAAVRAQARRSSFAASCAAGRFTARSGELRKAAQRETPKRAPSCSCRQPCIQLGSEHCTGCSYVQLSMPSGLRQRRYDYPCVLRQPFPQQSDVQRASATIPEAGCRTSILRGEMFSQIFVFAVNSHPNSHHP